MLPGGISGGILKIISHNLSSLHPVSSLATSIVGLKWEENKSGFTVINAPLPFWETGGGLKFDIFTAVNIKMAVFWDVTPCHLVDKYIY
jgi:hypothetical protein